VAIDRINLFSFDLFPREIPTLIVEPMETLNMNEPDVTPKKRGFAALDPERRREIASLGGKSAHQCGHGRQWDSEEAKAASLKRHGPRKLAE
jgi:hypothetical protein